MPTYRAGSGSSVDARTPVSNRDFGFDLVVYVVATVAKKTYPLNVLIGAATVIENFLVAPFEKAAAANEAAIAQNALPIPGAAYGRLEMIDASDQGDAGVQVDLPPMWHRDP